MNYNTTFLVVKSSPVYSDVCGKVYKKRDRIIWKSGNPYEAGTDKTFSLDTLPQEYTAYGNGDYRINGLETEQADGSDTANLKYESYEISKGKYR